MGARQLRGREGQRRAHAVEGKEGQGEGEQTQASLTDHVESRADCMQTM